MRITCVALVSAAIGLCSSPIIAQQTQQGADVPCNVTAPNGVAPGSGMPQRDFYGNQLLAVGPFGLWPNGTVVFKPTGAGFQTSEGFLVMKFGWTLGRDGKLQVTGHRLDGNARAPARLNWEHHHQPNFKPSYLIFPTPGCWEVNAKIDGADNSKLTFVTRS